MKAIIFLETHEIGSEIKCPYCGAMQSDSWEILENDEDSEVIECECGKNFVATKHIMIDYRTSKDCMKNGEEHEWFKSIPEGYFECRKCGASKYEQK